MVSLYKKQQSKSLPPEVQDKMQSLLSARLKLIETNGVASMQPTNEGDDNSVVVSDLFQATLLEKLTIPVVKVALKKGVQKQYGGHALFLIVNSVFQGLTAFFSASHHIDVGVRESNKGGEEVYTGYFFYLMTKESGFEEFKEVLLASKKDNTETQQTAQPNNNGWGAIAQPQPTQPQTPATTSTPSISGWGSQ